MKTQSRLNRLLIAAALFAGVIGAGVSVSNAETIQKLKSSSVQRVINIVPGSSANSAGIINDATDATIGTSTTIDLAGGYTDKLSYTVSFSSAAGSGALTSKIQISPDGGTTWVDQKDGTGLTITAAGVLTGGASHYANAPVQPGTKARIVLTLTGGTSFYSTKVHALPSVD